MTEKPEHEDRGGYPQPCPRHARKSVWEDAEIAIDIEYTRPSTALDDHLREEQTRALLDLLADYMQKLDKSGNTRP
jgi:hypothetical protein